MSTFLTLDEAKTHLRLSLTETAQDADVTQKLDAAEAIMLSAVNLTPDMRTITAAWDAATVPLEMKQMILLELGELWRFRGDDAESPARHTPGSAEGDVDFSPAIHGLLRRLQPKVLA